MHCDSAAIFTAGVIPILIHAFRILSQSEHSLQSHLHSTRLSQRVLKLNIDIETFCREAIDWFMAFEKPLAVSLDAALKAAIKTSSMFINCDRSHLG